ncbi:MAG: chemotaxis protein CheX [Planctomycetes bacterium]|nr:chemotaxis protein CheX [Planctomycetota bacterium]
MSQADQENLMPQNLDDWARLLRESVEASLMPSMHCDDYGWQEVDFQSDGEALAAFVALSSDGDSVQVGFSGKRNHVCNIIAQMFGFDDLSEPDTDINDIFDGLGELINIVAGNLHQKLSMTCQNLQLSIPLLVSGDAVLKEGGQWKCIQIEIGSDTLYAIMIRGSVKTS